MFKINIKSNCATFQLQKSKRIGILIVTDIRQEVEKYFLKPFKFLVFDLSGIEFIDSAGFTMLIDLQQQAKFMGKEFFIINTTDEVKELIHLAKLDNRLSSLTPEAYLNIQEQDETTIRPKKSA